MPIISKIDCSQYKCALREVLEQTKIAKTSDKIKTNTLLSDVVELTQEPKIGRNKGQIYKKVTDCTTGKTTKQPIEVDVEVDERKSWDQTVYTFKDKGKDVGYVILENHLNIPDWQKIYLLTSDIPEFGIVGDRVIVQHLMNLDQANYAGIGELADRITVEHCNRLGIKPVVIAEASYNSHVAHYKRGKRYLYSNENNNPNNIIKEIIEKTPEGEKCNTGFMGMLISYMPDELIEKIQQYLSKNPILK